MSGPGGPAGHNGRGAPLLETRDLKVHFVSRSRLPGRPARVVRAVDGVSLRIARGSTVGLVGESGSGKSTLGKTIVGAHEPTEGSLWFEGRDVATMDAAGRRRWRAGVQMVFQDPFDALNPRMRVGTSIAEPLVAHRWGDAAKRRQRVRHLLHQVGLEEDVASHYPHEFSGGQLQRVVIARAIAMNPSLVVCDEPTSALDVSTQAVIVNLLKRLQRELGLSYLFISHDLGVVRQIADVVAVIYGGKLAEVAPSEDLFARPLHPYAAGLMAAVPGEAIDTGAQGGRLILAGDAYDPASSLPGCRFAPRCPFASERCHEQEPPLEQAGTGRQVACHHWEQLERRDALTVVDQAS